MNLKRLLAPSILILLTGCVGFFGQDRAVKIYPRPAKETLVAVNQALRDLNFFPADVVPTQPYPRLTYFSNAYREESLGDLVTVAVRDLGGGRSQVEVLTQGDVTGSWTWSNWWPPLIFEQTDRRLLAIPLSPRAPASAPQPPRRPVRY